MNATLAQCTKEKESTVFRFSRSENLSRAEIHSLHKMETKRNRKKRYINELRSKTSRASVKYVEKAGRPSTSTIVEKTEQAQQMVLSNRHVTID